MPSAWFQYQKSLGDYRRIDKAIQAQPEHWLPEKFRRLADRLERDGEAVQIAIRAVTANWVSVGLPVEDAIARYEVEDLVIDLAIVEKARLIG